MDENEALVGKAVVARLAACSAHTVLNDADRGRIPVVVRTVEGTRLFRLRDARDYAAKRASGEFALGRRERRTR
jgi:hypothetical protein